jgi:hypothetical protein
VDKERREQAEWAAADVLGEVLNVLDDFRTIFRDRPSPHDMRSPS